MAVINIKVIPGVIIVIMFILPIIAIISDKGGMSGTDNMQIYMHDKKDEAWEEEIAADDD